MSKIPSDLAMLVLAALCVVAITILAALGADIPEVLSTVALVAAGAGGGAALPRLRATQGPPVESAAAPASVGVITS